MAKYKTIISNGFEIKDYQIPFRKIKLKNVNGDIIKCDIYQQLGYNEFVSYYKENYSFKAEMTITRTSRGRSSTKIHMEDHLGNEYEMFPQDFIDMLKDCNMEFGTVSGWFTFCKRGQNYGVLFLK